MDQVLNVLLTLPMFIGASLACLLDNTVPGATREERGLRERGLVVDISEEDDVYSWPPRVMAFVRKIPLCVHLPFVPRIKTARRVAPES